MLKHRGATRNKSAPGICERHVVQPNFVSRFSLRGPMANGQLTSEPHGIAKPKHCCDRGRCSVERPTEPAECDHRHPDCALCKRDCRTKTDVTARCGTCNGPKHHKVSGKN